MNKDRRLEVKVGLFVVGTLVLAAIGVLLLGKSKHVFEHRVRLHATFSDVAGLVQGAPVRLSGVNVGTVSQIMFVRAQPRPQIRVDLQLSSSSIGLVRADSVARISAQGLLGDKIIEISAGSDAAVPVGDGGSIQTASAPDLDKMMQQAAAVLDDAKKVADRAASAVNQFADPKTIAEVRESVLHIHALLHATEKGEGLAHALFYDKRTANELTRLETNLSRLTEHVDRGVQHLDAVLASTDGEGKQLINNVSRAAKSVAQTSDQIQQSHVVANLSRASGDLATMTAYMKSGQGTLGALVVDPTVYEQLVQVLGGVGRSRVLRALVRYAISRDDEKGAARVVDEKNVPDVKTPDAKANDGKANDGKANDGKAVKRAHDSAKR
ncbi:MAG TPA: MlaD family protein [Polyangia bacterium]